MSGPKCSEYELEEIRRQEEYERLQEELRREEERKRREQKQREDCAAEFNAAEEAEFQRLLEQQMKRREQEIIAEAIDETLEEMGYELVASMTPKVQTEEPFKAQVFSFADGVGIQVMEANGQVSMEVVGLGTNNRFPTAQEAEYLTNQMEDFCGAYKELEEKLAKKGVIRAASIRRHKPDKKFARILNMSTFEQKKDVKTLQTVMKKEAVKSDEKQEKRIAGQHGQSLLYKQREER